MSDRTYKYSGYIEVDIDDVRDWLEDKYGDEIPDDYEPTDDEWSDAAWDMLIHGNACENIEDFNEMRR